MLHGETARTLYHEVAGSQPIIDYHCHISPKLIAEDHRFSTITELMLGGDHYKWRMMRSCGVDERYITGNATDAEKFHAFARCLPLAIGNPLYHWTSLELLRYFDVREPLCEENWKRVYDSCNERLADPEYSVRGLIRKAYRVQTICTTDDPLDDLACHSALQASDYPIGVYPAFRPDAAVNVEKDTFLPYVERMGVSTYSAFCELLRDRIEHFARHGCRVADHALEDVPFAVGDAEPIFDKRLRGETLTREEIDVFRTAILTLCATEYAKRGWVMQLHIGALRNNNSRMLRTLGADSGFDSIGDRSLAAPLAGFLDSLDAVGALPKTILYSLNPKDLSVLGTMIGCFQGPEAFGKLQLGAAWWFNDQRDGMEEQLRTLADLGVLGTFVGMLTDSRSFVSYTRHEYFRRILCDLIGGWVDRGEYPNDPALLEPLIGGICYGNAKNYFGFPERGNSKDRSHAR